MDHCWVKGMRKINFVILWDKLFKIYSKLPHCIYCKKKHTNMIKKRFDYSNLSDISIFASNCIGGEIYHLLGLRFNSPLINISMDRKDFVQFCEKLKQYLELPIQVFLSQEEYCIGKLGGGEHQLPTVTIKFPHDSNPGKVIEKWNERRSRVNFSKLVLINDDKGLSNDDIKRFNDIRAFRKICLTALDLSTDYECCFQLKKYEKKSVTGKYNKKTLDGMWEFVSIWDYVGFLMGKGV